MKQFLSAFLAVAGIGLLSPLDTNAQFNLGVATSNWSATNALYLNPANIADCREKLVIDIFSVNGGVDNNLGTIHSLSGVNDAIKNGNINNLFNYSNSTTFSLVAPYLQVRLPGFMWSINKNHSVAFTNSVRGINQFNNFDQSLFRTIGDPNYVINGTGTTSLTSKNFNYTAHLWTETGFTYAGVLLDQDEHEIKVGATLRYLRGIGYIGLKGSNLDILYKSGTDSVSVKNSDLEFASNILNTKNAVLNGTTNGNLLSEIFGGSTGKGFGGDIGIVYDYMPQYARETYEMDGVEGLMDNSRNRYLLRFSASVMDIGSISYDANSNSNANVTGNGYITGKGLSDSVKNYEDFRHYAVQHGFKADTAHAATRVYMPTTLRLSLDYNVYRNFFINALYVRNLADRMNFGNSYYNQLTVTPRYDRRMLSVGMPITYSALTQKMKIGAGVRYAGFFIGSDDMTAVVSRNQSGINIYVGGNIPFYKAHKHDRDGDHVSDDIDDCPDAYGTWQNKGCPEPDSDHGGSSDTTDNCPDMPMLLSGNTHKTVSPYKVTAPLLKATETPADRNKTTVEFINSDFIK